MAVSEEKYIVEIERDTETGIVRREVWSDENLKVHRIGAPALTERDEKGRVVCEAWRLHGSGHRDGGPAQSKINPQTGVVVEELWRVNGRPHRLDGPAEITRNPQTGRGTFSRWYVNGERVPAPRKLRHPGLKAPGP
jgi:hypothetical protein